MTLGTRAMKSSLSVDGESNASLWWHRLGGREVKAEIGDAAQRVRAQAGGRDPELHPGIVRPAAPLLQGLAAAQSLRELEIQLGHSQVEGPGDRDQLLAGDVLEAALYLRQVGGRHVGRLRQGAEGPLGVLAASPDHCAEGRADRFGGFAVSEWHRLWA